MLAEEESLNGEKTMGFKNDTKHSCPRVIVYGATGFDYIAKVKCFPRPDDKIRTDPLVSMGGGNAANTATALCRLGLPVQLISKIGDDNMAATLREELARDGVDTSLLFSCKDAHSPMTYVIVDTENNTRTCLHTPLREDITLAEVQQIIREEEGKDSPAWIHFDSRHTASSVVYAANALKAKVPLSVDAEKLRPGLETLLSSCAVIFTNQHFPSIFCTTKTETDTG